MAERDLRSVFRYRFDNFMARGGRSVFASLVVLFVGAFVLLALLRSVLYWICPAGGGEIDSWFRHMWISFLELCDVGAVAEDSGSSPWYKFVAVLSGFTGVVIFSVLIAFLTTSLDQKLAELRKGRSRVLEDGHTLVLGWNERVVEILRELVEANESEKDACAVILADREKEEMDDYLALHLPERKTMRVVTRTGNPAVLANLGLVGAPAAKSVIVLANCGESASEEEKAISDARVVKTVLAVLAGRPAGARYNVVAEVFHSRSRGVVESLSPEEVTTVDTRDVLARMLVQTSRCSGLAVVYSEMLGFAGNEMYFRRVGRPGLAFDQAGFHLPDGVPLGVRRPDGSIVLNPPAGTALAPEDDLVILASDDSAIDIGPAPVATPRDLPLPTTRLEGRPERILVLGWNPKAPTVIEQFGAYAAPGSMLGVVIRQPSEDVRIEFERLKRNVGGLRLQLVDSDPMRSENLLAVRPFEFDQIVILSQGGGEADAERVDSETIIVLLLLRSILDDHPDRPRPRIITEVMDSENQDLVARAGVNDFIISNRLVSMIFAQVSEQRDIKRVYDDLFRSEGSEVYVKPVSAYFPRLPVEATFADLMLLARKRGEVCLGVRLAAAAGDPSANHGVTLNPDKNGRWSLADGDALVVLAEDDT